MHTSRILLLFASLLVLGSATAHADSFTAYFDLICPSGNCGPGDPDFVQPTVVAPEGQVTFTLNPDGTVAATVMDYGAGVIEASFVLPPGFGGYATTPISAETSGYDYYYNYGPGFGASYYSEDVDQIGGPSLVFSAIIDPLAGGSGPFSKNVSWTIGNPGEFTAALQAVYYDPAVTTADVFLEFPVGVGEDVYGAYLGPNSSTVVPEPATVFLLGTGALALLPTIRRRLAQ